MTDGQAQRRLRLNYVVAELDVVLHELLADVPFVTETTLRDKYRQLCGKELKSVLDAVGMMLHELVELKFADAFVAVRNAKMTDFLRRKFVNQPVVLAADASRKDAGVQQVRVKAEPGAVSVGSLDSAYLDLADAAVAADASDDAAPKPKRALMGEPEERGGNAGDGDSASGPVAVRVGPTPPVMSYFDAAQSLGASKIQSKDLEHTRRGLLLKRQDTTGGLALSVFDFHALINNESTLTHAEYARQKSSGNQWKKVAYRLLSFGLKDLHLECVHDPDRAYTIRKVCRVSSTKHYVRDEQEGNISVKNLFKAKHGVRLEYPHLPVVSINSPDGRREFVPMECVQVVENEKLLFVSILATRQATAAMIRAVYGRSRDATGVFKKTH